MRLGQPALRQGTCEVNRVMNKIVSAIKAKPKWFMSAVGLGVIAIGVYIAFREWDRISRVLTQADIGTLAIAGLLTVASYLLFLVGFIYVHRLFDFTLPVTSLSLIGLVSSAMNHLLPLEAVMHFTAHSGGGGPAAT